MRETRKCQSCQKEFTIEPEDFDFYQKIKVPPPTFCPECRLQRRLVFRNERTLYKRKCDLCGEEIIAIYPKDTIFSVYCHNCWYSDKWDASKYSKNYDFSCTFFKQFKDLQNIVPRSALQTHNCQKCDYANQIVNCKNCYLATSTTYSEDCLYSHRVLNSKDIVDCFLILYSELCYQSIECRDSSRINFSIDCSDSIDLSFCFDNKGCQNCFMTFNKRRKSNYFYNEQFTKECFQKKIGDVDTDSFKNIQKYKEEFEKLKKKSIHRFTNSKSCVNSIGHAMTNAKNCRHCFNVSDVENCSYCLFVNNAKDSFDINNGCCVMELNYEVSTMGLNAYNVKFSVDAWPEITNVSYINFCGNSCDNLFGCIGFRKKQYCILNKQYTKEEYEKLVPKIIEHMNEMPYIDKKGRVYKYGEFFPPELSPFAYNETIAQEYFPLSAEAAAKAGFKWKDPEERDIKIDIKSEDLPDHIKDVSDDIVGKVIQCSHAKIDRDRVSVSCNEQCTTAFKLIEPELQFYRRMNLPLPRLCPNCRHYQRIKQRNPLKLWHRKCQCAGTQSENGVYQNTIKHFHGDKPCPNEFETTYAPERPEIVYCEKCYLAEVV